MFLDFEKKRLKTVKNVRIVSQFHSVFNRSITGSQHSAPESHGHHQTSCSEVRTQETMQLITVCDKRYIKHRPHWRL